MENEVICLHNAEGKEWLIQSRNCRIGCGLYQPSAWRGKLVVGLLPYLSQFHCLPFKKADLSEKVPIEVLDQIKRQFGAACECSAFMGTPGTHKKATIQISRNNIILGYAKYSDSPEIQKLFLHEKDLLDWFHKKGIAHIPVCIELCNVNDSLLLFLQSTEKQAGAKIEHRFSGKHQLFLDKLFRQTRTRIQYEATDFYRTMSFMQHNADFLSGDQKKAVKDAIAQLNAVYANRVVAFGACHRDFTPWNTCILSDDTLFVFDWEYAQMTYPEGIDKCHFLVQTMKLEKHFSIAGTAQHIRKNQWFGLNKLCFMAYCLDNAAIYLQRGARDDLQKVKEQIELLERICE